MTVKYSKLIKMNFLLNADNIDGLNNFLRHKAWLKRNEVVFSATKPGEGNMNCVLRITTNMGSYIIKQSRSYVEKYPQVAAPKERAMSEAAFYNCIQQNPFLLQHTPQILNVDEENNVLLLEDLGTTTDFTYLYEGERKLTEKDVYALTAFLNELHVNVIKNSDPLLRNESMKQLNHQYIFVYPFMENNGLDLNTITEGLQELSMQYKKDETLKAKAKLLGEIYLEEGNCLLHGDYYPGSWLNTNNGIKIIDPEFSFFGYPEFDLAVMIAHCYLSAQPQAIIDNIMAAYKRKDDFNEELLNQFIGIEIMRRLLGLAQVPFVATLETKKALLKKSYAFIMS